MWRIFGFFWMVWEFVFYKDNLKLTSSSSTPYLTAEFNSVESLMMTVFLKNYTLWWGMFILNGLESGSCNNSASSEAYILFLAQPVSSSLHITKLVLTLNPNSYLELKECIGLISLSSVSESSSVYLKKFKWIFGC